MKTYLLLTSVVALASTHAHAAETDEREPTVYMYSGNFATPVEWEADLLYTGNHARFCEAIGKEFVAAEDLVAHVGSQNGYFYEGWYYFGPRFCDTDLFVYGHKTDPSYPYNVWIYNGGCGCCIVTNNLSLERRALITCQ